MRAEGRSLAKPFLQPLKIHDPFQRTATYLAGMSLCKERGTEQLCPGRCLCREAQEGKAPAGCKGRKPDGGGWCATNGKRSEQAWETAERRLSPCPPSSFPASQHLVYSDPRPHALFQPVVNLGKDEVGGETRQRAKHIQLKGRGFHIHIWWNFIFCLWQLGKCWLWLVFS